LEKVEYNAQIMKILVCIKQVVNLESEIKIDPEKPWVKIGPSTDFTFNRFDEYAVEEAVLIKEKFPETTIDILSVGPERALSAIKRLQGLGADHGIHILTRQEGYLSPFVVAQWIAALVRGKNYDLILTGVMSEDEMQGQVGPLIAGFLEWPCATSVIHEEISPDAKHISVEREIEGGFKDALEIMLPALLTIQSGINEPRYPTLTHMLRAKREKIEVIDAGQLEDPNPRQMIRHIDYPQKIRAGLVLKGSPKEKAIDLLTILNQKAIISLP
jgi:electron transfer flavoprotein beta subunit